MSWDDEAAEADARRLERHVARVARVAAELAERYVRLLAGVGAGGSSGGGDGEGPRPAPGPRVPVRVDVLDVLCDVEAFAGRYDSLVRGTLRLGSVKPGSTPGFGGGRGVMVSAFLARVGQDLAGVYAEDPGLGDEVSVGVDKLNNRAGVVLGERPRTFRAADPCESCGGLTVRVDPARRLLRCIAPGCGWRAPVGVSVGVYSTTGRGD